MSEPDAQLTWTVEYTKITKYLLNLDHKQGASKAKYLLAFGFGQDDPEELARVLVRHAVMNLPGRLVEPPIGALRRVFEGYVETPDGRLMSLRTVWEMSHPLELRLVTAVPLTK